MVLLNLINYSINNFCIQYRFGGFCRLRLSFFGRFGYNQKLYPKSFTIIIILLTNQIHHYTVGAFIGRPQVTTQFF